MRSDVCLHRNAAPIAAAEVEAAGHPTQAVGNAGRAQCQQPHNGIVCPGAIARTHS